MSTKQLLLTVDEAAERLGIGRSLAYAQIRKRKLRSVKIGRARRVPVAALEEFIILQQQEEAR